MSKYYREQNIIERTSWLILINQIVYVFFEHKYKERIFYDRKAILYKSCNIYVGCPVTFDKVLVCR